MNKIEELRRTYQKAQITLIERINANLTKEDPQFREKMLRSVDAELKALDKYAEDWTQSEIPRNYLMSVRGVYKYLDKEIPVNLVMRNQQAMDIIMQNMLDDLHDAHNFVGRQVRDNLRQASLEAVSQKLAVGDTIQQTKDNMVRIMTDQGITAITDKAGRNLRLDSYAEMVARTTTREATNKACMNTMTSLGEDLVQMTAHGTTCPICKPLEGRVYSITGQDTRYPKVSQALPNERGVIHPNCFIDGQVPLMTSKGWKPIGEVAVGDLVLTHKGRYRKVTQLHRNQGRPHIVRIFVNDGKNPRFSKLTITDNHPVFVNGGWAPAINIKKGDVVKMLAKPCEQCGKPTPFYKKTCSSECALQAIITKRDTPEYWKKISAATTKRLNRMYSEGLIDRKKITANANKRTREMVVEGTHPLQKKENQIKGQRALGRRNYGKTWIEEKMGWYLKEQLNLDIESQFPIPQKRKDTMNRQRYYFADFLIKGHDVVVECDGSHWHQDKQRDSERQKHIESKGYTVLRFTDQQIHNDLVGCGEEVLRVLANHAGEYQFMDAEVTRVEISEPKRTYPLYNISVEEDESYIAKGFVVHNCLHSLVPYIEKYDSNAEKTREESNRPFEIDEAEQKKVDKYNAEQKRKTVIRNNRRQYERYKMTLGEPKTFSAFMRKKKSDSWDELESKYRKARMADGP